MACAGASIEYQLLIRVNYLKYEGYGECKEM